MLPEETGVANVADPLGGSWYVEALTDRMEAEAERIFDHRGDGWWTTTITSGVLRGIEDGWFMAEIADASFAYQVALEKGEKRIVGVNCHTDDGEPPSWRSCASRHEVEIDQVAALAARRAARDDAAVRRRRWTRWSRSRGRDGNMVPPMLAGLPRRGHAGRDLRRAARRVGRVPRARPVLTCRWRSATMDP